jgi:KilA-N domain
MNQMLLHNWNGNQITQVAVDTRIASFDIPANYVNATQMCKACGKQFNDYSRLETTKAYWNGLSAETGIPVSGLVISIKGGNDKQVQGTWVNPEIAIDLAQWVSVEFRIWANRTLRQVIKEKAKPSESQSLLTPTPEQISQLFDLTLGKTDLDSFASCRS